MTAKLLERTADGLSTVEPLDIRSVREGLELTQAEFARMTRISLKSITNWENGQSVSGAFERVLREIQSLQQALSRNLAPGTIGSWLRSPNPYFGDDSPAGLVQRGETQRLWRFIYRLEAGEPS